MRRSDVIRAAMSVIRDSPPAYRYGRILEGLRGFRSRTRRHSRRARARQWLWSGRPIDAQPPGVLHGPDTDSGCLHASLPDRSRAEASSGRSGRIVARHGLVVQIGPEP